MFLTQFGLLFALYMFKVTKKQCTSRQSEQAKCDERTRWPADGMLWHQQCCREEELLQINLYLHMNGSSHTV